MENKKIITILLAIIICLNLIGAIFLITQQVKINKLNALIQGKNGNAATNGSVDDPKVAKIANEQQQKIDDQLKNISKDNVRTISGKITDISNGVITVDAQTENLDAIKQTVAQDGSSGQTEIPLEQKSFAVKVDGNTKFDQTSIDKLKKDDYIVAQFGTSVYGKTDGVATEISLLPAVGSETPSKDTQTVSNPKTK